MATGGTAGQLLAKLTATNYDTHWIDPPAAGGPWTAVTLVTHSAAVTLTTSDLGKTHVCTVTSAYTVTLPAASSSSGMVLEVVVAGSSTAILTLAGAGTNTIDGAASRVLWAGESAILFSNGTTWTKIGGKTIPMSVILGRNNSTQTFSGQSGVNVTLVMDTVVSGLAAMFNSATGVAKILRPGNYLASSFVWSHGFNAGEPQTLMIIQNSTIYTQQFIPTNAGGYMQGQYSSVFACVTGDLLSSILQPADNNAITVGLGTSSNAPQLYVTELPTW